MPTFISILRGINVSGQKLIKMEALKEMYEKLGFTSIQTYIQSGNVVFRSENSDPVSLEKMISQQILKSTGFEVPVIVLDLADLKEIISNNPFLTDSSKEISHLHVTILSAIPDDVIAEKMNAKKSPDEDYSFVGRAIYLYCPNGYGRTKLHNNFIEKAGKVPATTRNWKTILEIFNIAERLES